MRREKSNYGYGFPYSFFGKTIQINRLNRKGFWVGASAVIMCAHCVELDKRIERYQRLSDAMSDPIMLKRLEELAAEAHAQKASLHSKDET